MTKKTTRFPFTPALPLALLLVLTGLLGACKDDPTAVTPATPQARGSNVFVDTPAAFTTSTSALTSFTATIPSGAVSIGLILRGSPSNFVLIEHENILGTTLFDPITGPGGGPVPVSFNMFDSDGNGIDDTRLGDNLANRHAEALLFPNDGTVPALAAGTYTFPVAAALISNGQFTVDTIQPYVLYKTSANTGQTMDVNLFVVSGVRAGITSTATAAADAEIIGAIAVLKNVFQVNVLLGLTVNVTVTIIADTNLISIDSEAEQDALLRSYPSGLPSDALNLFIVGALAYVPGGVIGLSAGIPGPFQLHGTIVSGTLAEYQGDGTGTILGFTLAHEFGHYLGLWHTSQTDSAGSAIVAHDPIGDTQECSTAQAIATANFGSCPDVDNLMFPFVSNNANPPITANQAQVILNNPAIYAP